MTGPDVKSAVVLIGNEGGGIASLMTILLSELPPDRRPEVIVLGSGELAGRLEELGIDLTRLGGSVPATIHQPGRLRRLRSFWNALRNVVWVIRSARRLARHGRRTRVDVVHVSPTYPALVASMAKRRAGFRLICHCHVIGLSAPVRRIQKRLTRSVDRFLAISEAVKASLPAAWREKTQVIHNAIDVEALSQRAEQRSGQLRQLVGVEASSPLIVSLATFARLKGQHLLVEAMAQVARHRPDAVCAFLGRAPARVSQIYLSELEARAGELGLSDQCRFFLDVPEAPSLLGDADALIMTTWGPGEGFGLVAAEAMACGVPVVAFDAGAASEVVERDQTGVLVADEDGAALADAIVALLDDRDLAQAMGQAGRRRVRECFGARRLADEVLDAYSRVMSAAGGPSQETAT